MRTTLRDFAWICDCLILAGLRAAVVIFTAKFLFWDDDWTKAVLLLAAAEALDARFAIERFAAKHEKPRTNPIIGANEQTFLEKRHHGGRDGDAQ